MKTYVFDLDGTLCISPRNYKYSKPIEERIKKVNELQSSGARIVIFTARGMHTFRGVRLLAWLRWGRTTRRQLAHWGVRYHRLILGKPSGDYYIDDKGINAEEYFSDPLK
jgi:hypothetical protein